MFEEEAAERKRASQFGHAESRENTVTANLQSPGGTADAKAAELLNVSERSVATASRVLKLADEQVIAAVASGDVAISDAAAVGNLPKDEQRQALEAKREGRARTLRQAAEKRGGGSAKAGADCGAPAARSSRRILRGEANRFARELDKLYRRLDALTAACGGANEYTDNMRHCLRLVIDAFRDFAGRFLSAEK